MVLVVNKRIAPSSISLITSKNAKSRHEKYSRDRGIWLLAPAEWLAAAASTCAGSAGASQNFVVACGLLW